MRRGSTDVTYLHPFETYSGTPPYPLPFHTYFISGPIGNINAIHSDFVFVQDIVNNNYVSLSCYQAKQRTKMCLKMLSAIGMITPSRP